MATATSTTSHTKIQRWVKARGGHPARVSATGKGNDPGILRIDFPGYSGADTLEEISWDEFFEWFDRNNLAMLLADGPRSRFSKLVARGGAKKAASKKTASKKTASKKAPAKKTSAKKSAAKKTSSKKRARR